MGKPCRYDGKSKPNEGIKALAERYELLPVCPECMGGLPTPRPPAEIMRDGSVINREGRDVSKEYRRGAELTLAIAKREGCSMALLKEKSPSCGRGRIYDGSFTGTLTEGDGVCAALLLQNGIEVYGESEIKMLLKKKD